MSHLKEKFYGKPGESTLGKIKDREGPFSSRVKYAVNYSATKYFLTREAADEFYRNIKKGARLLRKNENSDDLTEIKSK